eukprot:TRINITY_DN10891_c0_g1_i2.p1 TRINITY_DN10891_c0_g1~~TRINITY_DN10891_c0_g1_i2.p1  ORF type:complete len:168 (+),score=37.32 TRINITY_DN10891_c0_g1_i2:112-615(+)
MESLQQIKGEIPSLKDICVKKAIEKGDFSPEKILDWWDFAGSFGNKGIAEHVRSLLNTRYEYYLEKIGEIVLKERLGEDVYRELFERKELKMWRRSASFSGSIIDKPPAKDENGWYLRGTKTHDISMKIFSCDETHFMNNTNTLEVWESVCVSSLFQLFHTNNSLSL